MKRVTAANLETVRETLRLDQRPDLEPGCITWPIREGAMTIYPRHARVVVSRGGDSDWGDYTGTPGTDSFRAYLDAGVIVQTDGNEA